VWLALSPGRRRLRFSFQFNDVKDPTGFPLPHCLAPVVGGGGYLLTGIFRVNRSFQTFLRGPGFPGFDRKNHRGPPRGFPQVRDDSIEGWEHTHLEPKIKHLVGGDFRFPLGVSPAEAAI
jgi:hypothetical protein